jgi:hypothetical protein
VGTFSEKAIVEYGTVYLFLTKEKKLSVSIYSKQTDVFVSILRLQETKGSYFFLLVPFSFC